MEASMDFMTTGLDRAKAGYAAAQAGRYDEAIVIHQEALEWTKTRACGEESVPAATSFNHLGETYLKLGELDKAEDVPELLDGLLCKL